ncbi:MAG: metallophosphoesterase [Planctomycetaceae bacterium]|nr:metallophosphoesterase [Planctomycetaceae bacterium]
MILILLTFVFFSIGHLAFWCTVFNQIHATRCPRTARKGSELLTLLNVLVLFAASLYLVFAYPNLADPLTFFSSLVNDGVGSIFTWSPASPRPVLILACYWYFCSVLSFYFIARWIYWKVSFKHPAFFTEHETNYFDFEDEDPELLHGLPAQLSHALLPGSQLLVLSIESKTFEFPNLPAEFDGYRISHLSDLHFTGRIGKPYFRQVIEHCLRWEPDLICITGDLIDKAKCLGWIEELLARLHARDGVYFVLGNHDRRIKSESMLRARLAEAGLTDANGRYISVERGSAETAARLWFAGNELPWYAGAEKLEPVESVRRAANDFFIALSHSPDQWPWAKQLGFDLMLAGHTHGGQVCLPIIGPIIAPSRFGVRYAGGVFDIEGLALQVSRGISGAEPLRWNCPPELAQLTLRCSDRT